jgi:hypothetical protein
MADYSDKTVNIPTSYGQKNFVIWWTNLELICLARHVDHLDTHDKANAPVLLVRNDRDVSNRLW